MHAPARLLLASSNVGKLREYRAMSSARGIGVDSLERFQEFPAFPENAPTFAENAAGKALHYSRCTEEIVFADDSGLVVPALGGKPGVQSARYAGPMAGDTERIAKLLAEMRGMSGQARAARFVCVIAAARRGKMLTLFSDAAEGVISEESRGQAGFGYDPVFYFPPLRCTFAQLSQAEKNEVSHRGRAFRKLLQFFLFTSSNRIL